MIQKRKKKAGIGKLPTKMAMMHEIAYWMTAINSEPYDIFSRN
jgi:hypothetical protein